MARISLIASPAAGRDDTSGVFKIKSKGVRKDWMEIKGVCNISCVRNEITEFWEFIFEYLSNQISTKVVMFSSIFGECERFSKTI